MAEKETVFRLFTFQAFKITVFGLSLLCLVWGVVLHRIHNERLQKENDAYQQDAGFAVAFEEHIRRILKTADMALVFYKMEYEKYGQVTECMYDFVEQSKGDPILNQIALANSAGDLILSAVPQKKPINIAHREHFQVHVSAPATGLFIAPPQW